MPAAGINPLLSLYFPRLYYLRGRLADHQGKHDQALQNYRLFLKLSGDSPDIWDDMRRAREAAGAAK